MEQFPSVGTPNDFAHILHVQEKGQNMKDMATQWKNEFSGKVSQIIVELMKTITDKVTRKCETWLNNDCSELDVETALNDFDCLQDKFKCLEGVVENSVMWIDVAAFRNTAEMVIFAARIQKTRSKKELFDLEPDVSCLI